MLIFMRRKKIPWEREQMRKLTTTILLGLIVAGCAEYLPMPSGALEGRVQPLPLSLDRITQDKIIQLETGTSEAYSSQPLGGRGRRLSACICRR